MTKTIEQIGVAFDCGKVTGHSYCPVFEEYFGPLRYQPIQLLELGIDRGASLRMWLEYFPNGQIYGVDSGPPVDIDNPRCFQFQCPHHEPQINGLFGSDMFDVIIDDGSHDPHQQLLAHQYLWHSLRPGGLYFVEDMPLAHHTSQILVPWSKMYGFKVWTYFKDLSGNFRDDDCLVLVRKPE